MKRVGISLSVLTLLAFFGLIYLSQRPALYDALIWYAAKQLDFPASSNPAVVEFEVREGETAASIARRLEERGLIRNALIFRTMARLRGIDGRLEAGEYRLRRNMTANQVLDELQSGRFLGSMITIPEGWRAEQIADLLQRRQIVDRQEFLELVKSDRSDPRLARERPPEASLEGYLFPDTYRVPPRISSAEILRLMTDNFNRRFPQSLSDRLREKDLSLHEAVTLASIVEREAVVETERTLIAGVYLNRLRMGMKLDADPTVQYALTVYGYEAREGDDPYWKRALTYDDLLVDSAYNTYRYTGLPPGPICNPGLASLMAVLEAEETDYVYFVARPDGSHDFSRTMEEHLEKVRKYRSGG